MDTWSVVDAMVESTAGQAAACAAGRLHAASEITVLDGTFERIDTTECLAVA